MAATRDGGKSAVSCTDDSGKNAADGNDADSGMDAGCDGSKIAADVGSGTEIKIGPTAGGKSAGKSGRGKGSICIATPWSPEAGSLDVYGSPLVTKKYGKVGHGYGVSTVEIASASASVTSPTHYGKHGHGYGLGTADTGGYAGGYDTSVSSSSASTGGYGGGSGGYGKQGHGYGMGAGQELPLAPAMSLAPGGVPLAPSLAPGCAPPASAGKLDDSKGRGRGRGKGQTALATLDENHPHCFPQGQAPTAPAVTPTGFVKGSNGGRGRGRGKGQPAPTPNESRAFDAPPADGHKNIALTACAFDAGKEKDEHRSSGLDRCEVSAKPPPMPSRRAGTSERGIPARTNAELQRRLPESKVSVSKPVAQPQPPPIRSLGAEIHERDILVQTKSELEKKLRESKCSVSELQAQLAAEAVPKQQA